MSGSVPILMYHRLATQSPKTTWDPVTPSALRRQMRWLAAAGFSTVSLDLLVASRRGEAQLPRRPVIISFDDGYQSCLEHAVPLLTAHGFTATFFLVAGLVGGTSIWRRGRGVPDEPLFDWAAARRLASAGFTCAAHGLTHHRLTEMSPGAAKAELIDSRRMLEDELGREVGHMAYPYGSYDPAVRALAIEAGYRSACSTRSGLSRPDDDLFALHRVTISALDSILDFACRLRTAESVGAHLRRAARYVLPAPTYGLARSAWRRLCGLPADTGQTVEAQEPESGTGPR
jgi:peptidoglycan/xylan/chitin deacetylase (PgdA/CDA1 family)